MATGQNWEQEAECRHLGTDRFFVTGGSNAVDAKALCQECPVQYECLNYAMAVEVSHQRHGVWGGFSPKERDMLARQRRKARLAK